jgi:DNA-directed RNA polymerase delta subunit/DNA-binding CsgD family transcriptional regulator
MNDKTIRIDITQAVNDILGSIDHDREKEIISRRFGLFDRKETLEQIGELLGITRERVRQLEKAILTKLKASAKEGKLNGVQELQDILKETINDRGGIIRVSELGAYLTKDNSKIDQAQVYFISEMCPDLIVVPDSDFFYQSVGILALHNSDKIKQLVDMIVATVKKIGSQAKIEKITEETGSDLGTQRVRALASISKQLATLNGKWGLIKWPTVNPKNIRDKIYVILKEHGSPMHFNEISEAIKKSEFKRKDVTTQAIHNELIKDKRFVLIGRGIYALKEWGYEKGTVAEIIADVLKKAERPLHRDEIIKEVLKSRFVKETTILLNLQGKPQFKRVAKATYGLDVPAK